jgi:hypothetical protein
MTPAQLATNIKKINYRSSTASDALLQILRDRRLMSENSHDDQQQHWLGWLKHYNSEGYYGRKNVNVMDAKLVYNRIVCPPMVLWLAEALRVSKPLITEAFTSALERSTLASQSAAIRKVIPWEMVDEKLRGTRTVLKAKVAARPKARQAGRLDSK